MSLEGLFIARGEKDLFLLPRMANRHGLVAGATGTGKTVTLQVMAEHFSRIGVPVFVADVKGDLAGLSQAGAATPKIQERLGLLKLTDHAFEGSPVTFWDIFGEKGHPVRTTVSDMGPLLLSRLLNLNDVQSGVLTIVFHIADDSGLHLLDFKDLRAMAQYAGDHAGEFETDYGRVSTASIGAIQRGLLTLDDQDADLFFGEPALDLEDLMQTDPSGRGQINILAADRLMMTPRAYSTFLLWLMAELFERLPEVGDQDKPRLVFFFDEAHLLFTDAPPVLMEKIEQVVRLIRSKGVGIYFVTQSPLDVPESVLGQLGNRVQHALRAYTPKDQKAVRVAAQTFRQNPALDTEQTITALGVGEALVSTLDAQGVPGVVQQVKVAPPGSRLGPIDESERRGVMDQSLVKGVYEVTIDRVSAYELLEQRAQEAAAAAAAPEVPETSVLDDVLGGVLGTGGGRRSSRQSPIEAFATSAARSLGTQIGRQLMRGVMGSLFGGSTTRRRR